MRVRDVEIALVLAREMKAAAERDVDASLRLQQLQEVFGAERLDRGERARIQTALRMAGLEPRPSLLDADLDEPIRFALEGGVATATEAPPAEAPAQEKQEFPTVGEFFKRRFKGRKDQEEPAEEPIAGGPPPAEEAPVAEETAVHETLPEPAPEEPVAEETVVRETLPEPEADDPVADEPSVNGNVAEANGHAHLDFDDVLPAHETATPADFGASSETVDFGDPRVEEELAQLAAEEEEEEPEVEPEPEAEIEPEPEPVPEQPVAVAPPPVEASPAVVAQQPPGQIRPAAIFAAAAVPVVVASFAGWAFGLAFVALGLVALGFLRHASFRTLLIAGALVTVASLALSFVLAGLDDGSSTDEPPAAEEPAAPEPEPKAEEPEPAPKAEEPKAEERPREEPAAEEPARKQQPKAEAPTPDEETEGLIRVPPGSDPSQEGVQPAPEPATP